MTKNYVYVDSVSFHREKNYKTNESVKLDLGI